ncbi:MAG: SDR family NAD(P)-dependent oxidoreductase [Bacteroidetes bacterium]|nr:SDR family NAD(P)-dependent oxidoreductase [Bacteroidota bacterium]
MSKKCCRKIWQRAVLSLFNFQKKEKLEKLTAELIEQGIDAYYFTADAGDTDMMKDAFDQIWEKFDFVDVVHYNAAKLKQVNIINETSDSLTRDFKLNVGGVMTALKLVLPDMERKISGAILLTGGGFAFTTKSLILAL